MREARADRRRHWGPERPHRLTRTSPSVACGDRPMRWDCSMSNGAAYRSMLTCCGAPCAGVGAGGRAAAGGSRPRVGRADRRVARGRADRGGARRAGGLLADLQRAAWALPPLPRMPARLRAEQVRDAVARRGRVLEPGAISGCRARRGRGHKGCRSGRPCGRRRTRGLMRCHRPPVVRRCVRGRRPGGRRRGSVVVR